MSGISRPLALLSGLEGASDGLLAVSLRWCWEPKGGSDGYWPPGGASVGTTDGTLELFTDLRIFLAPQVFFHSCGAHKKACKKLALYVLF